MNKKIIFLFLTCISNNIFCQPCTSEKEQSYINDPIVWKQLEILEQQSKDIMQAQTDICSLSHLTVKTMVILGSCLIIGLMIDAEEMSKNKALIYGMTCIGIAHTLEARDIKISSNLKAQQKSLTSAIAKINKKTKN
jgi:hypothetical protein